MGWRETAISVQNNAYAKSYADRKFEESCNNCCRFGINIPCESCRIKVAHEEALRRIDTTKQITVRIK